MKIESRSEKESRIQSELSRRPQVALVARSLVQWIHSRSLGTGDTLPSQAELRDSMGFHNNTINAAMAILTECGIVTRKRKTGTVVENAEAPIPGLWRVGVVVPPQVSCGAFYTQLQMMVLARLAAAGVAVELFADTGVETIGSAVTFRRFRGLEAAHADRRIEGLFTPVAIAGEDWSLCARQGLAISHAGAWEDAPAGVVIEQGKMVEEAVAMLVQRGCRSVGIGSVRGPHPGHVRFLEGFRRATAAAGLAENAASSFSGGAGAHGGSRIAGQLLALPAHRRPQGLIVVNDLVASGLCAVIASTSDYRPAIVVQTNRQAPLAFALPVIHCEVDVEELASRSVANLLARMRNPALPLRREWAFPHVQPDPQASLFFVQNDADPAPTAFGASFGYGKPCASTGRGAGSRSAARQPGELVLSP
ncbi:MAG: GntR family transcriptional regulator [Kiritimatiellia bacterium]|jgi:DNA-binding LacI/PurR family transcriptional regulator